MVRWSSRWVGKFRSVRWSVPFLPPGGLFKMPPVAGSNPHGSHFQITYYVPIGAFFVCINLGRCFSHLWRERYHTLHAHLGSQFVATFFIHQDHDFKRRNRTRKWKKTILITYYGMGVKNMHGDPNRVRAAIPLCS